MVTKAELKAAHGNNYDWRNIVKREAALIAGPMKMAAYRVLDPETGEHSPLQFHLTYDNTVMAVLGEASARMLADFINRTIPSPTEGASIAN